MVPLLGDDADLADVAWLKPADHAVHQGVWRSTVIPTGATLGTVA